MKQLLIMLLSFIILGACTPKISSQQANQNTTETTVAKEENKIISTENKIEKDSIIVPAKNLDLPKLPLDKTIRYGTLPNGLKYYIKQNNKPENRVEFRLAVNAGSNQEDDNQKGLAHFLEHMAFNGSTHFKKNDLVNFLEGLGVKFGAHLNAYTSFDETVYMLQLPTDKKEVLDKGFLVLEDWASGLGFDSLEIEKERGVVVSEWRSGLGPNMRMLNKFLPTYYYQSRYAERLPIGDTMVLKNCTHERIKTFYQDWYRPNLMAIMVVGNIDVDAIETEIKNRFSNLKNPSNEKKKIEFELPKHKETLISICTDDEATNTQAYIVYKHDKQEQATIEGYAKYTMNQLINTMFNNRLAELTQKQEAPFVQAFTAYDNETRKNDALSSFIFMKKNKYKEAIESILEENKRVKQYGFTQSELERAKIEVLKNLENALKEKDKTESKKFITEYVAHFLRDVPAPGIETEYTIAKLLMPNITTEAINALAESYITNENRVIIITAPTAEKSSLPTENEIQNIIKSIDTKNIEAYKDATSNEPLIAEELKEKNIISKITDDKFNIVTYILGNGATVKIKNTDFKNDEILFAAYSPGGTSLYDEANYMSADYSNAIISESGLANFDKITLQKMLVGKTVSLTPYIDELDEGFEGATTPDDLETLMQLLYLYQTSPRKSDNDFATFMQQQHAIYDNIFQNPQYYFYKKYQEILYKNNIRRGMPTKEKLNQVNLDNAFKIYKERFSNAADFTYFFVGNIAKTNIESLIKKYIGSIPTSNTKENWKDTNIEKPIGSINSNTEMGTTPKTIVGLHIHGNMTYNEDEVLKFNMMSKILSIILRESLREDKGGVYGVSVQNASSKFPKEKFGINIMFNADPPKAQELIQTVKDEIAKFISNGTTEEKLNKVKETLKREHETNLKENNFWIEKMISTIKLNSNLNSLDTYINNIDKITLDNIKLAAGKYLGGDNFIQVTLEPKK
jgi:zinc protease